MRIGFDYLMDRIPGPPTKKWPDGVWFARAFASDTLSVQLYTPKSGMYPVPPGVHIIYIVMRGRAHLKVGNKKHDMQPGDVVPIGVDVVHEFENFTKDFATYVIFWRSLEDLRNMKLKEQQQKSVA